LLSVSDGGADAAVDDPDSHDDDDVLDDDEDTAALYTHFFLSDSTRLFTARILIQ